MKTLMIVDDTFEQREMLNAYFCEEFKVVEATSGNEAASLVEVEEIDLIISDLQMPDGDGLWLLSYIRSRKENDLPVIIVSGHPSMTSEEIKNAGANFFFPKPYDVLKLRDAVYGLLGKPISETLCDKEVL